MSIIQLKELYSLTQTTGCVNRWDKGRTEDKGEGVEHSARMGNSEREFETEDSTCQRHQIISGEEAQWAEGCDKLSETTTVMLLWQLSKQLTDSLQGLDIIQQMSSLTIPTLAGSCRRMSTQTVDSGRRTWWCWLRRDVGHTLVLFHQILYPTATNSHVTFRVSRALYLGGQQSTACY